MDKEELLKKRMKKLLIFEEDLEEKFILGSGKGGQKVNKTNSCVYLKHQPTSVEIKCQKTRSQSLNRYYARKELCEILEERLFQEKSKKQQEISKLRKQKKRRSKKAKEKILKEKKHRSEIKSMRKAP